YIRIFEHHYVRCLELPLEIRAWPDAPNSFPDVEAVAVWNPRKIFPSRSIRQIVDDLGARWFGTFGTYAAQDMRAWLKCERHPIDPLRCDHRCPTPAVTFAGVRT